MQSFSRGLELTSAGLLTFVTMYIFGSLWVTKQSWFRCLVPGIMRSIVGAIFLFSRQLTPLLLAGYAQNVLLSALSPLAFDALLQKKRRSTGAMMALAFFLIGLSRLPLPWNLNPGIIAACGVTILGRPQNRSRYQRGGWGVLRAGTGYQLDVRRHLGFDDHCRGIGGNLYFPAA